MTGRNQLAFLDHGTDATGSFIGPLDELWDLAMLVRHRSVEVFFSATGNEEYVTVLGHGTAALADSRLLPTVERD